MGASTITTVRDAAVRLGPEHPAVADPGLAPGRPDDRRPCRRTASRPGELWERSVAASIAADDRSAPAPAPPIPAEAGTAALLHDFGKVVLAKHFGNQILDTLALAAANDGLDIVEAERVVFGLTHAEIGGRWPRSGASR